MYHKGKTESIDVALHSLTLGTEKESTVEVDLSPEPASSMILLLNISK